MTQWGERSRFVRSCPGFQSHKNLFAADSLFSPQIEPGLTFVPSQSLSAEVGPDLTP